MSINFEFVDRDSAELFHRTFQRTVFNTVVEGVIRFECLMEPEWDGKYWVVTLCD